MRGRREWGRTDPPTPSPKKDPPSPGTRGTCGRPGVDTGETVRRLWRANESPVYRPPRNPQTRFGISVPPWTPSDLHLLCHSLPLQGHSTVGGGRPVVQGRTLSTRDCREPLLRAREIVGPTSRTVSDPTGTGSREVSIGFTGHSSGLPPTHRVLSRGPPLRLWFLGVLRGVTSDSRSLDDPRTFSCLRGVPESPWVSDDPGHPPQTWEVGRGCRRPGGRVARRRLPGSRLRGGVGSRAQWFRT